LKSGGGENVDGGEGAGLDHRDAGKGNLPRQAARHRRSARRSQHLKARLTDLVDRGRVDRDRRPGVDQLEQLLAQRCRGGGIQSGAEDDRHRGLSCQMAAGRRGTKRCSGMFVLSFPKLVDPRASSADGGRVKNRSARSLLR